MKVPVGRLYAWKKFRADSKKLEARFGRRPRNDRQQQEQRVIAYLREYADKHRAVPSMRQVLRATGVWREQQKKGPECSRFRRELEARFGPSPRAGPPSAKEQRAIAFQLVYAEQNQRLPSLRTVAHHAGVDARSVRKWPEFRRDSKRLEAQFGPRPWGAAASTDKAPPVDLPYADSEGRWLSVPAIRRAHPEWFARGPSVTAYLYREANLGPGQGQAACGGRP